MLALCRFAPFLLQQFFKPTFSNPKIRTFSLPSAQSKPAWLRKLEAPLRAITPRSGFSLQLFVRRSPPGSAFAPLSPPARPLFPTTPPPRPPFRGSLPAASRQKLHIMDGPTSARAGTKGGWRRMRRGAAACALAGRLPNFRRF